MKIQSPSVPAKWLRVLIPTVLIIIWFALSGIGGPYFGKISQVTSNDQTTFLPKSAESTKVNEQISKFQNGKTIPAVIVFSNDTILTSKQVGDITTATAGLKDVKDVTGSISPPVLSDDGKAAFVVVNTASDAEFKTLVPALHSKLDARHIGVDYKVTGPVGFIGDLSKAFAGIDGILLIVALVVVFVILLVVYRSPLLPFIVLFNAISALSAAILIVWHLANIDVIEINGQVQGILFILVIGAATDYSLLFVSRYREELERHIDTWSALWAALKGSFEPILAAGGTVIVGLLCLLLSDLNSNKALGPVGAIGIALAMLSALTFLPAMLAAVGRKAFWPRTPHYQKVPVESVDKKGAWPRIGAFVSRHPRAIWLTSTVMLVICAFGMIGLKADGISQSDIVLGPSEARDGQNLLNQHFPGGSGTPVQIIASSDKLQQLTTTLESDSGVSSVQVTANDSPSGSMPLGKAAAKIKQEIHDRLAAMPNVPNVDALAAAAYPFKDAASKVVDGKVLLQATITDSADSTAAQNRIAELRSEVHKVDSSALVGGVTATQLDTNQAAEHDRTVVIPIVLIVITIILMLLLRSITAPLLLLLTTVLSFTATLGIAAMAFNHLFHFPNSDPSVVLYGFVFLVALGIDYNIFLMTRVREESLKLGTKKGVILGLIVTGGVITSAGIVLAATFAALAVIPVLFLVQLAFIVAFGVLLDTTVVRSLLVPSLIYDIGKRAWWPAKKPSK
jgi:RND superfamily putative drug exporter